MDAVITTSPFVSRKDIVLTAGLSIGYLLLSFFLIGYKPEQLFLVVLFNSMYYLSRVTRKLIIGFSVFIIYWIIFDYMKAFPNYRYQDVHIESLYHLEKSLFGIHDNGQVLTPNEYLAAHQQTWMDVAAGLFYLSWVPVPLVFAGWLFYKDRKQFVYYSSTFLLVNLIGFVFYYIYPAAPPWYIQQYGFDFQAATPGNVAGLGRFDAFFHANIFGGLYAKSSNVFAAMPSLHSAYPVITFYYALKSRMKWGSIIFALIMVGIWLSAIYTSHHYVCDVLAGILCAVSGIIIFRWIIARRKWFHAYLTRIIA